MTIDTFTMKTPLLHISLGGQTSALWSYTIAGSERVFSFAPPRFEVDGVPCIATLCGITAAAPRAIPAIGVTEYRYSGTIVGHPELGLTMIFRVADASPVVRFRYVLTSTAPHALTKADGHDATIYLRCSLADVPQVTEVRLSEYNEFVHSYCLAEYPLDARQFADQARVMGPMLVGETGETAMLIAYEHGSQSPDAFLDFRLRPERAVELCAVKGNYCHGQPLDTEHPYATLWFQCAGVAGDQAQLAAAYRRFVLRHMSENQASRTPYIFYNTWAYQERNNAWNGQPYLASMQQERMLAEIEVAHRMGIDVFVLDTGWYEKTGDWRVNTQRFPDNLDAIKEKLNEYGMKLGLWFSPTEAAISSKILHDHQDCLMSQHGTLSPPHPVWESEDSRNICLVSGYREAFADELIRLVKELGVTYFKWDAIGQYGCDGAGHGHGDAATTEQERADSYAFQLGQAMGDVVNKLCRACPEAIVDFDVTEGGRCFGLGFLEAGKYFLNNNGPYYDNFNIPDRVRNWNNIFVFPGPARGWVCRTPLTFDKWIPSVLFLTHYLPDDPANSQRINIGSLILGQNGIWGDLLAISDEGIARFAQLLGLYKQVRDDITESTLARTGTPGGSPEICEKIAESGKGAVVIFANASGRYTYYTQHVVDPRFIATEDTTVTLDASGHAIISCAFTRPDAHIIFFGVE